MSALSEHYAGKECPGDYTDEDIANLTAFIWAAGADQETADFVAKQLLKKGLRLVPHQPTDEMWLAGKYTDAAFPGSYAKMYCAMIEAAPRA